MESQWPKNSLTDLRSLMKELNQGQEFTHQLREMILKKPLENGGTISTLLAEDLVGKIMDSFCNTLSIINSSNSNELLVSPVPVADLTCRRSPEDSTGCSGRTSSLKDGRGVCNKKRKISGTTVKETSTLVDDGHAWRKYGQKQILDNPFPRSYYRCTHKFDQGCGATKQEQRIQANPPKFQTIYQGHHTCTTKNYPTLPQILSETLYQEDSFSSSAILSFNSNTNNNTNLYSQQQHTQYNSIKYNRKPEHIHTLSLSHTDVSVNNHLYYTNHNQNSSSSDHFIPSGVPPMIPTAALSTSGSDNGDFNSTGSVYSSCCSSTDHTMEMDMDMIAGLIDFNEFM